ncbi:MAG: hypothetical protein JNL29_12940 [Nitrospira sp.]|nr:hypothetical protein [Nitrospira sp.]
MHTANTILLLTVLLLTGCANSQGFDRTAMGERLHLVPTATPETQPRSDASTRPSPPFRLGVFFAKHDVPDTPSIRKVEWFSADRDDLLRELTPLQDEHLLSDTFVLTDVRLHGDAIKEIRQAGARFGADMILIVDGVAGIDRYNNRFAWLYPTIIGAYLAPGTESDALVMATAHLFAVGSDWHTPIQTAEGHTKVKAAMAFVEDAVALHKAKQGAIHLLAEHISERLRSLK